MPVIHLDHLLTPPKPKPEPKGRSPLQQLLDDQRHLEAERRYYDLVQTSWYDDKRSSLFDQMHQLLAEVYELDYRRSIAPDHLKQLTVQDGILAHKIKAERQRLAALAQAKRDAELRGPRVAKPKPEVKEHKLVVLRSTLEKLCQATGNTPEVMMQLWGITGIKED